MNTTAVKLGNRKGPGLSLRARATFLLPLEINRKCHLRYYCITIDRALPVGKKEILMLFLTTGRLTMPC